VSHMVQYTRAHLLLTRLLENYAHTFPGNIEMAAEIGNSAVADVFNSVIIVTFHAARFGDNGFVYCGMPSQQ